MALESSAIGAPSARFRARDVAAESKPGTVRILKFGGSSVGTPDRIVTVGRIVLDAAATPPGVVVVSAFQGVTNDLLECARLAERRNAAWERGFEAIAARHRTAVGRLVDATQQTRVGARVEQLLADLNDALRGVALLRSCPASALDSIASFGERLSALI